MNIEHEIYEHELDLPLRKEILTKQRIVVKIGSSSLMHPETGRLDLNRMEVLVRELCNIRNSGKEVVLVTSGAIGVGKSAVHVVLLSGRIFLQPLLFVLGVSAAGILVVLLGAFEPRLIGRGGAVFDHFSHSQVHMVLLRQCVFCQSLRLVRSHLPARTVIAALSTFKRRLVPTGRSALQHIAHSFMHEMLLRGGILDRPA